MRLRMYCQYLIYLCSLMQFFKRNIFGILAIVIAGYLLGTSIFNIYEIQDYNEFKGFGEYITVEENVEPNILIGGLKMSLMFLFFLLIPVVLSILHKRKKASKVILYLALGLVGINFLVFPYILTLLYNSINSI